MKIPKEIKGKNRLRDFRICLDYIEGKTPQMIIHERKLSLGLRRVQKILYDNAEFVNPRIQWPKSKRIHRLQNWIGERKSRKDPADLLEQVRKEVEGDKPLVDNSKHTHVTYVYNREGLGGRDTLHADESPDGNAHEQSQVQGGGNGKASRENRVAAD